MCLRSYGSCRRWRRTSPQRSRGCGRRRTRWCCTPSCWPLRTTRGFWMLCLSGPPTSTPSPPSPSPLSTGQARPHLLPLTPGLFGQLLQNLFPLFLILLDCLKRLRLNYGSHGTACTPSLRGSTVEFGFWDAALSVFHISALEKIRSVCAIRFLEALAKSEFSALVDGSKMLTWSAGHGAQAATARRCCSRRRTCTSCRAALTWRSPSCCACNSRTSSPLSPTTACSPFSSPPTWLPSCASMRCLPLADMQFVFVLFHALCWSCINQAICCWSLFCNVLELQCYLNLILVSVV